MFKIKVNVVKKIKRKNIVSFVWNVVVLVILVLGVVGRLDVFFLFGICWYVMFDGLFFFFLVLENILWSYWVMFVFFLLFLGIFCILDWKWLIRIEMLILV